MEKESDNDIKPTNEEEKGNHPDSKPDSDDTAAAEPLYFNKDGKFVVGITAPTAYAVSYPYPPLPSNLAKNRVLRVSDEQTKESVKYGIAEAEKDIEKEAMPLPGLTLHGSPLPKVLVPEIELALYWDRHPYEFRPKVKDQESKSTPKSDKAIRRSKSEMNLASKVGKLLEEYSNPDISTKGSSGRSSSISGANKAIRSPSVTTASSLKSGKSMELLSPKKSNYGEHSTFPIKNDGSVDVSVENRCTNGKCGSGVSSAKSSLVDGNRNGGGGDNGVKVGNGDGALPNKSALQLSENERKKFEDIKLFHRQNERDVYGQGSHSRQPKLIRSQEQVEQNVKKSAGVQVTIDDVSAAAMKSTYLCPLHGQYRRGIERRDKGGFRTDMGINNVHANCSRALKGKPTRTKMIKTVETQTEQESGPLEFQKNEAQISKRSRTAGHTRSSHKARDVMASEYHNSFKNPYKIAESEKRHLRNKILNYCFTKHSIF